MPKISRHTPHGKILLALRAGPVEHGSLHDRIGYAIVGDPARHLVTLGLISKDGDAWSLTPAGHAACPSRREPDLPIDTITTSGTSEHVAKGIKAIREYAYWVAKGRPPLPRKSTRPCRRAIKDPAIQPPVDFRAAQAP